MSITQQVTSRASAPLVRASARLAGKALKITHFEPLEGHWLRLDFSDGAVMDVDLRHVLARGRGLRCDPRRPGHLPAGPRQREVRHEWPGRIDLDPEVLYGRHEPASRSPIIRRTVRLPPPRSRNWRHILRTLPGTEYESCDYQGLSRQSRRPDSNRAVSAGQNCWVRDMVRDTLSDRPLRAIAVRCQRCAAGQRVLRDVDRDDSVAPLPSPSRKISHVEPLVGTGCDSASPTDGHLADFRFRPGRAAGQKPARSHPLRRRSGLRFRPDPWTGAE